MQFALVPVNPAPPTGNATIDADLARVSMMYGGVERVRSLLHARADVMMTSGVFLFETKRYWKLHDRLLAAAMALREKVLMDYGVEAPAPPEYFFSNF